MKKTISFFLVILFLYLCCLAACGGETSSPAQTTAAPEAVTTVAETEPEPPDGNFEGADFNVLAAVEQWQEFYLAEMNGEVVNDAVYDRNRMTEEKYNIKLNYLVKNGYMGGMSEVHTALSNSVMSGAGDYDFLIGGAFYVTGYVPEGLYADLRGYDQIGLDHPWYDRYVNEQFEVAGRQYLVSGALGVFGQAEAVVTFFNKNLAADYNLENLYDTVKSGKWTYGRLKELGKVVTTDLDGDGKYGKSDRVGLVSSSDFMALESGAMGYFYTEETSDGGRILKDINEKLLAVNDLLCDLYESDLYLMAPELGGSNAYEHEDNMQNFFISDGTLFLIHKLDYARSERFREMENFGILPSPKYDEAQENYITPVPSEAFGIPAFVKDEEMSAVVLEGMQYLSYNTVNPAYFETAIKRKSTRDEDSVEMLEIISSTKACDFMFLYTTSIGDILYDIADRDYVSKWAKNYDVLQAKMEEFVETVKGL